MTELADRIDPWPFRHLVLRTPRLELRPDDDEGLLELAEVAVAGVHPPEGLPLGRLWRDESTEDIARGLVQALWRDRANLSPVDWSLNFLVRQGGQVIGFQGISANQFAVKREVATASWLGMPFQGKGFGTEARTAVLTMAFDYLAAVQARTTAWEDAHASQQVSRKLGYRPDGTERGVRRGRPSSFIRMLLRCSDFDHHRPTWPLEVEGLQPCLPLLGTDQPR
ncbi:GNAT family protein [Saccharopolyspora sp. NPDC050389]|uniref:GNAT family N-acetyltransferase n=1 Tax=Saccharopolyspora sp. NPDC050389 TaxID=3155516 RepID=UPI0033CF8A41